VTTNNPTIGWIERREPRGLSPRQAGLPRRFFASPLGGTAVFARVLQPDPGTNLKEVVSIVRGARGPLTSQLCFWLLSPGSAGGSCGQVPPALFAGGTPITWTYSLASGSDQYGVASGLAADGVQRLEVYLANGDPETAPLRDNAYIVYLPRAQFPVKLVAYDRSNKVVGISVIDNGA